LDCGFNSVKLGGLFSKSTREGVSATESRWIKIGRHGLDLGREKEGVAGQNSGSRGGSAMNGGESTTTSSVQGLGDTVSPTERTGG